MQRKIEYTHREIRPLLIDIGSIISQKVIENALAILSNSTSVKIRVSSDE